MTTNAQAALAAAAVVFSGSKHYASINTVQGMAAQFKRWLDAKDTEDAAKAEEPTETVSHHISCASRIRQAPFPCDCKPVEYDELKPKDCNIGWCVLGFDHDGLCKPTQVVPKPGPRRCDSTEWCSLPKGHDGHHHLR
jgi:hypothetical protein